MIKRIGETFVGFLVGFGHLIMAILFFPIMAIVFIGVSFYAPKSKKEAK